MSTSIIYRVENAEKQGVWGCGAAYRASCVAENEGTFDPNSHPGPSSDNILRNYPLNDRYFAVATLDEYRRWFSSPAQRFALTKKGVEQSEAYGDAVMLVAYQVPTEDVIFGERQAIFYRHNAVEVARWECDQVETNPEGFQ